MRLNEQIIAPTQEAFPVKKLSKTQSRKHIKKRKAKVVARHAKAGHWHAQAQPILMLIRTMGTETNFHALVLK